MTPAKEQELIDEYKSTRDLKVLAVLFKQYNQQVFRTSMKYLKHAADSEDACVDVFLLMKDQLLRYDVKNFGAWLYTSTRNHCIKKLKQRAKTWTAEHAIISVDMNFEEAETHQDIWLEKLPEAIDELSDDQRNCIVLFYLHSKSYKEISVIKGYRLDQVRSYIQHGKIKLKKILTQYVKQI